MAEVLYVSMTGALQPLGQSQVVQYLLGLASEHKITLLSFESADTLKNGHKATTQQEQFEAAGVRWIPLKRHTRFPLSTFYDIIVGSRVAARLIKEGRISVVHCRSYVAGLIGLIVKKRTGAKFLFDMRGLWPDERVDGGIWSKRSLTYRAAKRAERALLTQADHIITITRAGLQEVSRFDYLAKRTLNATVIPTCTNTNLFHLTSQPAGGFVLGYVGSVGSWYRFDEVARAVARLFVKKPSSRLLVINRGSHDVIRADLIEAGVDLARVTIKEAAYDEVAHQIASMNAGIFFIKPTWSKKASCPTRMGEFLACGRPILTNEGIGDVSEFLAATNVGVSVLLPERGQMGDDYLDVALDRLISICAEDNIEQRCRAAATEVMSLDRGIASYSEVYRSLSKEVG